MTSGTANDDGGTVLDVGMAASRLGISTEAVRKRIKRGTLRAYKRDGEWRIVLPAVGGHVEDTGPDARPDAGPDARDRLIAKLEDEVAFLRRLTEHQAGVIADLTRRPELPAGTPDPASEARQHVDERLIEALQRGAEKAATRPSWWRRLLGRS